MTQLIIDLPDWVNEHNPILILSGQELIAIKEYKQDLKIKENRCIQCGECCLEMPFSHTPFGTDQEGKCNKLEKQDEKWICTAGATKPFCCLFDPTNRTELGCSITYK